VLKRFQVVEYLLKNRASLTTVDSFGRTALGHATTDDVKALLHTAQSHLAERGTSCWMPGDDVSTQRRYARLLIYPLNCRKFIRGANAVPIFLLDQSRGRQSKEMFN